MSKTVAEKKIVGRLDGTGIGSILETYEQLCVDAKITAKEAMLSSICLDGILLEFAARFGEDTEASFVYGKRFGNTYAYVSVAEDEFDPIAVMDERDGTVMSNQNVKALSVYPSYSREHGANVIHLPFPRHKISDAVKVVIAIALGVLAGFLLQLVPDAGYAPIKSVLEAVSSVISGLISMTAAPVVLLTVITGIAGVGSVSRFGKIGAKVIGSFALFLMIAAVFGGVVTYVFFPPEFADTSSLGGVFDTIVDTLASLFPNNVVTPLETGNFAQIVMLAVFVGITVITLGRRTQPIMDVIGSLSEVFMSMLEKFVSLLPVVVFITVAKLIKENMVADLLNTWRVFVIVALGGLAMVLFELIVTSVKTGYSPYDLAKNVFPAAVIGHTTASSCAALYKMREITLSIYHCDEGTVNFALPMGITSYGTGLPVLLSALSVYASYSIGSPISAEWILLALLVITLFSMFAPPVAGGVVTTVIIVFAALGLPVNMVDLFIPLILIGDYFYTGYKVSSITLTAIRFGAKKEKTA